MSKDRLAIETALIRADVKAKDIEAHKIMSGKTFYKKRKSVDDFTIGELKQINKIAPFTEEEWLAILGR